MWQWDAYVWCMTDIARPWVSLHVWEILVGCHCQSIIHVQIVTSLLPSLESTILICKCFSFIIIILWLMHYYTQCHVHVHTIIYLWWYYYYFLQVDRILCNATCSHLYLPTHNHATTETIFVEEYCI